MDVANNATVGETVPAPQQGRADGALFGSRTVGLAIGPAIGGLVGISAMRWLFLAAAVASLLACVPMLLAVPRSAPRRTHLAAPRVVLWRDKSVLGVSLGYAAAGVVIGVYEVCWSLLLHLRGASAWQIGISWTLFAVPFAAMSFPGGWLVDHFDRRYLAGGSTVVSAGFAGAYPFLHSVWLLIGLGSAEAAMVAIAGPALAAQLAHSVPSRQLGRAAGRRFDGSDRDDCRGSRRRGCALRPSSLGSLRGGVGRDRAAGSTSRLVLARRAGPGRAPG